MRQTYKLFFFFKFNYTPKHLFNNPIVNSDEALLLHRKIPSFE